MSKSEAKKRAEKLRAEINKYRYAQHALDKSLISEAALDTLKKELFDIEQEYPDLVTADSPTQRVAGEPLRAFKKVRHEAPMISLNDAFSEDDVRDWLERVENYFGRKIKTSDKTFYCELKIDGLAIELTYENGYLKEASTRGDGIVGEDVTQNLRTVEALPLSLKVKDQGSRIKDPLSSRLTVRGEVFLTKKEFERINREQEKVGGKIYANPRNVAAGSIRQLDPKITASRKLDTFQYDIVMPTSELAKLGIKYHSEEHELLGDLGFKINPHNKVCANLDAVIKFRNYWDEHRDKLPYEIDGIVVLINDNEEFDRAGVIGKAPRGAIAYKFSPKEATTIVEDITVNVGRTGVLTPVANLRAVEVGGVTISHSTLHNYDEIKRLGLKIGDTVIVTRAGDVIPKITKVLPNLRTGKEKEFHMPVKCPVDGSKVIRDGVAFKCSNPLCGARNRENLYHFVSRGAFNLDGLGPKILDKFLDEGLITDAADIFSLKAGDIATLERFGEKSAENIIREAHEKKTVTLPRFFYSLGILHVGEETARLLAPAISNSKLLISKPSHVLKIMQKMSLEDLQQIPDIGPKVAESIYTWFHDKTRERFLTRLDAVGIRIEKEKTPQASGRLAGKTFVLTGTLESMSRDEAKNKIRELGGDISESVSDKTDYVVAGVEPGSKFGKAKKLGIKVLAEREFLDLIK